MKKFFAAHWIVIASIAAFIALRIIALSQHDIPYWDAAIYVGMGKYLFSHGMIGTWEILRPVALPIILGSFWKIGVNPYTAGMVFSLIISAGTLVLVYVFAEDIKKGAGDIAVLLLAATPVFFTYSAIPVTDIVSTFFALLSLWLVYKAAASRHYLVVGLVVAVAFMFRFPQGLLLLTTMVVTVIKMFPSFAKATARQSNWNDRIVTMIERVFLIGGGFCLIAVPFLVVNYYFYHNAFLPFVQATASINGYPSLYNKGIWFYLLQLLKEDFLLALALVPIAMLGQKKYYSKAVTVLLTVLVIVGGYFVVYQAHKELRYALAFLPYVAILAGAGVMYILEWTKMPRLLFFGLFLIVVFMFSASMFVYRSGDPEAPAFYAFDTYFVQTPGARLLPQGGQARILTTSPYTLAYSNVLITHNLYADWNAAYSDYNTFRSTNDYIALSSCSLELNCPDDGGHCTDDKQLLLDELNKQDTLVFKTTTPTPDNCVLEIYKIKH
jgi:4-amino-4-deoxy-L-arabinose transferase-like glycosyltransferase